MHQPSGLRILNHFYTILCKNKELFPRCTESRNLATKRDLLGLSRLFRLLIFLKNWQRSSLSPDRAFIENVAFCPSSCEIDTLFISLSKSWICSVFYCQICQALCLSVIRRSVPSSIQEEYPFSEF